MSVVVARKTTLLRDTLKLGGIVQHRATIELAHQTPLDLLPWRLIARIGIPKKPRCPRTRVRHISFACKKNGVNLYAGPGSCRKGSFTDRGQASYYRNLGLINICSVTGVPHCDPVLSSAR